MSYKQEEKTIGELLEMYNVVNLSAGTIVNNHTLKRHGRMEMCLKFVTLTDRRTQFSSVLIGGLCPLITDSVIVRHVNQYIIKCSGPGNIPRTCVTILIYFFSSHKNTHIHHLCKNRQNNKFI